jgi:hypothetical protein
MATLKNLTVDDTGFIKLPSGTTAQRPGSPSAGMMRYNTSTGVTEYYDGSNWIFTTPPTTLSSAAAIVSAYPTAPDGIYTINLPTVGSTPIYCAMSSTFAGGGGWMLAMKATKGTTFSYSSSYWTSANVANETTQLNRNDADAKFHVFNYYTASKFLAWFPQNSSGGTGPNNGGMTSGAGSGWHWLVTGQNSTALNRFQTSTQIVSNPRDSGSSWIGSGFSNQVGYQSWDFNYTGNANASVRWGFGWNNENEQASNDVSGGIGMSGNYSSFSAGDKIGCCAGTTGFNTSCRVEIWVQ